MSVEAQDRPILRSRVWMVAAIVLGVLMFVLLTIGFGHPATTAIILSAASGIAAITVLVAILASRRRRHMYENELIIWATERSVYAERLRIARDLHDLASHGLGLITVRAAAVQTLPGPDGDAERMQALVDIEHLGRQATMELRRLLTVLRASDEGAAPLQPAETLADLPRIIDEIRVAGVTADLAVSDLGEVSAGVQLTVCAIVREALANCARHAGATTAHVTILRDASMIVVSVEDEGPVPDWRPHRGAGQGILGLRERVVLLGGTIIAGPAHAGFQIMARIPDAVVP